MPLPKPFKPRDEDFKKLEEVQELFCHECYNYVQFKLDTTLNGRHVLNCPKCGHEHCRIVRNGKISDERWDQRNRNMGSMTTYGVRMATWSATSTTFVSDGTYYYYYGDTTATS